MGDPRGDRGRADEGNRMKKETACLRGRKGERGESDRVMEEILLKVMNVTLSFLLYDPGAFANYPDSQRSSRSLLLTGEKAQFQCQTLALL